MLSWKMENVNVYLLLDCAHEDGVVISAIKKLPPLATSSLYIGTKDEDDEDIGPHLVKVIRNGSLMQWFLDEGAGYGIILFSEGDIELLADHLRPFLECVWPDDRRKMFRFYDPKTFYYFYPSLTPEEQKTFLGPICGVACPRPICTAEGNSLFAEYRGAFELYSPPRKKLP